MFDKKIRRLSWDYDTPLAFSEKIIANAYYNMGFEDSFKTLSDS